MPLFTIAAGLLVAGLLFLFFIPLGRGAIFYPSSAEKCLLLAELSDAGPGKRAADLGAGDGRVVIALARRGAEAHGFEINPLLVLLARWNVRRAGLTGKAFIHCASFWRADLSAFDSLTLFQGSTVMRHLEAKVQRELAPGARVVSDCWGFPTLVPERMCGTVFCYRMGSFAE